MLRSSAQRLKRFHSSLSTFQSIQKPLSSSLDDSSSKRTYYHGSKFHKVPLQQLLPPMHFVSHRCFSTTQSDQDDSSRTPSLDENPVVATSGELASESTSFEDSLEKIFDATKQQLLDADAAETATNVAKEAGLIWDPVWWKPTDMAIEAIRYVHETTGMEYGWSIIAVTLALRILIFPVAVSSQANQSRMAHMMPEMTVLNDNYKTVKNPTQEETMRYSRQMSALFRKYNTNPLRGFVLPVVQFPAFLGVFFGMQKMAQYPVFHDELAVGGMLWFTDLTIPDPLYILPVTAAISFFGIVELTRTTSSNTGLSQSMQKTMTNFLRLLALIMIPVSLTFPSCVVAYWTTNNIFTFGQIAIFAWPPAKKAFGIWDAPKPVPGASNDNFIDTLRNAISPKPTAEELIKKHNDTVESQQKMKELSRQAINLRRKGGRKRR